MVPGLWRAAHRVLAGEALTRCTPVSAERFDEIVRKAVELGYWSTAECLGRVALNRVPHPVGHHHPGGRPNSADLRPELLADGFWLLPLGCNLVLRHAPSLAPMRRSVARRVEAPSTRAGSSGTGLRRPKLDAEEHAFSGRVVAQVESGWRWLCDVSTSSFGSAWQQQSGYFLHGTRTTPRSMRHPQSAQRISTRLSLPDVHSCEKSRRPGRQTGRAAAHGPKPGYIRPNGGSVRTAGRDGPWTTAGHSPRRSRAYRGPQTRRGHRGTLRYSHCGTASGHSVWLDERTLTEREAFRAARYFLEQFNECEHSEAIMLWIGWMEEDTWDSEPLVTADPAQWDD